MCLPGFGGLTGDLSAVRPAANGSQTGSGDRRGRRSWRSDRRFNTGQTGGIHSFRPADQSRSDRLPSISRVTFISAKSFRFLGIPTIHPPLVGLVLVIQSYISKCVEHSENTRWNISLSCMKHQEWTDWNICFFHENIIMWYLILMI